MANAQKHVDDANFEKSKLEFSQVVKEAVAKSNITPAQAQGMPEFMAQLNTKDEYEFSKGDDDIGTTKASAWFKSFLSTLTSGVEIGKELNTADAKSNFSVAAIQKYAKENGVDVVTALSNLKSESQGANL